MPSRKLFSYFVAAWLITFLPSGWALGQQEDPEESLRVDSRVQARARFDRGVRLYEEGDYGVALEEFQRAYELAPSYHVLYNVGQLYFQLDRFAEAYRALRLYLDQGGDELSPTRRGEVRRDIEALEMRTARLHASSRPATATVVLDGVRIEPDADGQVIDVGPHQLEVSAPGYLPRTRAFRVAAGDHVEIELALIPTTSPVSSVKSYAEPPRFAASVADEPPRRPATALPRVNDRATAQLAPWLVTGGLAIGWLTLAVLTWDAQSHGQQLASSTDTRAETLDAALRRTRRLALATDALLGATLAAGGVSLYLAWDAASPPTPGESASVAVPASWRLGYRGRF